MKHRKFTVRLLLAAALLIGLLPAQALFAQDAGMDTPGEVIAEGLNGPMGILVDPDGDLWVVDSGLGGEATVDGMDFSGQPVTLQYGPTARIVRISVADGVMVDVATLTSVNNGMENEGGSRLALLNGVLYVTGAGWHPAIVPATADAPLPGTGSLWRVEADGAVSEVSPLWELERDFNPVSAEIDTHPYGIVAGPDGNLWIADAGMNALLKVDPATGEAVIAAAFDPIPGVFPNPNYGGEMLTDAVPTGVTIANGTIYVSYLSGAPFIPGSAKVVTVAEDGTVSDYATGLTMLTDLRTGPDGALYAVQFGLFTEQGPVLGSGAVIRVQPGDASEVLIPGLMFPTSIDFNADGDAYVTVNGVGAPGSGQVVKIAGLTRMAGVPITEAVGGAVATPSGEEKPAATPETMPVTGGESNNGFGIALAAGLILFVVAGFAVAFRRRLA
jgi:hypothetical protein